MKKSKKKNIGQIVLHVFFCILCLCFILPLILVVSISLEGGSNPGFKLIPEKFTLLAYEMIFANPKVILDAYKTTIFYSVVGTVSSLVVMAMLAYTLSRQEFKLRNVYTFILFFTTLFSGGMVPAYILHTRYLHLGNTIWIYILPGIVNAWNIIVIRTYFQGLPKELFESARLDGASEMRICFQIAVPLSTPVLASVGFLRFIDAWNNWSTSQVYIKAPELRSLQYLLQQIMNNIKMVEQLMEQGLLADGAETISNLETMRFAMVVVAAGPAMMIFPFFQKYFAKGMTIGSVKG